MPQRIAGICGKLGHGMAVAIARRMTNSSLSCSMLIVFGTVIPAGGCALVNKVSPGGRTPASTSASQAATPTSTASSGSMTSSSAAAPASTSSGAPTTTAGPTLNKFEEKFAALLKDEARFSAAIAHGQATVCQADADRVVSALWAVETNKRGLELTCFPIRKYEIASAASWPGIREVQDHGALGTVIDDIKIEDDGYAITVAKGGVFAVAAGPRTTVAFFPLVGKPSGSHGDIFASFETAVDRNTAMVDVLTSDAASAQALDLVAERTTVLAKAEAAIKARGEAYLAKEAAALAKVNFPKAARNDAALVKLVHDYLQEQQAKTGVDPALVKKIIITSTDWAVRKNEYGLILGKTADVTVGFARANKTCAFTTLVVQRDYAGGGTYNNVSYLNGFQSGFEKILCERIK